MTSLTADLAPAHTPTVSERLADHLGTLRYEDIPAPVVAKAKDQLVHHLGLAFRGGGTDPARRAVTLAVELSGGSGSHTIIGDARRADLLEAIFANCKLMGHLGLDDFVVPPGIHPGVVIGPIAWAIGEAHRVSGRELLVAVIAGYDVMYALGKAVLTWSMDPPRRPNAVFAPFGGAAAAARLLKLSPDRTVHALGHAGHAAMGLAEGLEHIEAEHPLQARNGAMAALLARAGITAPKTILEGRNGVYRSLFRLDALDSLEAELDTLGEDFAISKAEAKRFTGSGLNIIPIDLAMRLVTEHSLVPDQVAALDVVLPVERQQREAAWEEATRGTTWDEWLHRDGYLPYRMASVIVGGGADPSPYSRPDHADFQALLRRMRLRFESGRPVRYARIEVTTTGGERHTADADTYVPAPVGQVEWLTAAASSVMPADRLERIAEMITNLEQVADVSAVTALFAPDLVAAGAGG